MFFGAGKKKLFGAYHAATGSSSRGVGVLLCYPFGQEYMRCHMAFRQLARQLAQDGFHVLRFDYFGTGDSAGDSEDGTIEQWLEDTATAIDELKDCAGVQRVWLVGLRFGGLLAAMQASKRDDLEGLVLWDPIVDGATYIRDLLPKGPAKGTNSGDHDTTVGVQGFPLTARLRESLHKMNTLDLRKIRTQRALIVVSEERKEYRQLEDHLSSAGTATTFRCVQGAANWEDAERFGAALLPQQVIEAVTSYVGGVKAA